MGGTCEVNSADQIDQLGSLRSEMKSGKSKLPSSKSEKISENDMPGMRKESPKVETLNKYGARLGKWKSAPSKNMGLSDE